jgi:hypothetical protein
MTIHEATESVTCTECGTVIRTDGFIGGRAKHDRQTVAIASNPSCTKWICMNCMAQLEQEASQ